MGVVSCKKDQQSGGQTFKINDKFERHYTIRYIILSDTVLGTSYEAYLGAVLHGLPTPYTPHSYDPYAYTRNVSLDRAEDPRKWIAMVELDNCVDTSQNAENPIDRPPKIRQRFAQFQKPALKDADGNLIRTTAGQPIIPTIENDQSRPVITIERNEGVFRAITAVDYQDAISTDIVFGNDAGRAKMNTIDIGEEELQNNVRFRRHTYEIHFDDAGWEEPILNRGTWFFDTPGGNLIKLPSGQEPLLLKKDGTLLNGTGFVKLDGSGNETGDKPYYLTPPRYKKRAFAPLNLEYSLLPIV